MGSDDSVKGAGHGRAAGGDFCDHGRGASAQVDDLDGRISGEKALYFFVIDVVRDNAEMAGGVCGRRVNEW